MIFFRKFFVVVCTVKALEKAREFETKKTGGTVELEDYIDSLAIKRTGLFQLAP